MFTREVMLREHLRHNCYPPIPWAYRCAMEAIVACKKGEPEREITTPKGAMLPAHEIVEQLHLEVFSDQDE